MSTRDRLSADTIAQALADLPGWALASDGTAIARRFTFRNFSQAWGFMARAALAAEKLDHHPDWSNSYSRVDVSLSTHSAGGITALDLELARKMNAITGAG